MSKGKKKCLKKVKEMKRTIQNKFISVLKVNRKENTVDIVKEVINLPHKTHTHTHILFIYINNMGIY